MFDIIGAGVLLLVAYVVCCSFRVHREMARYDAEDFEHGDEHKVESINHG